MKTSNEIIAKNGDALNISLHFLLRNASLEQSHPKTLIMSEISQFSYDKTYDI